MWKDFFYFSKSERRAVLFLLTLLFVFICMWVLFPVKEEETLEQDQEGIEEIKNFLAGVHEMEESKERWYWLLLIQIRPIPSTFCNVGCLLLLHILYCNIEGLVANSELRMISLVFMACLPRNLKY